MEKGNRLLYVGGVALLLVLALWAIVTRGVDEQELPGDGGPALADGADGAVSANDGGGDEAGAAGEAGAVPADSGECEDYCQQLEQTGGLAEGVTRQACVERLCAASSDGGAPNAALDIPPTVQVSAEETAGGCRLQCRTLQEQGELRAGTTLEQCYAALCAP